MRIVLTVFGASGDVVKGTLEGKRMFSIGRVDADLVLHHLLISRQHARLIESESGELVLMDLNSTNGTRIKDHRVEHAVLREGDVFCVGPFKIRIEECRSAMMSTLREEPNPVVLQWPDLSSCRSK